MDIVPAMLLNGSPLFAAMHRRVNGIDRCGGVVSSGKIPVPPRRDTRSCGLIDHC